MLSLLATEQRTIILYESPVRLNKTLKDLIEYFGAERLCGISRELTKMFEENYHGTLQQALTHFSSKTVKGEIVMVIEGYDPPKTKRNKYDEEDESE